MQAPQNAKGRRSIIAEQAAESRLVTDKGRNGFPPADDDNEQEEDAELESATDIIAKDDEGDDVATQPKASDNSGDPEGTPSKGKFRPKRWMKLLLILE